MTSAVQTAVELHCQHWNDGNKHAWMNLFAVDVTFDDPVGAPTKHGIEAVRNSWERSLSTDRTWHLVPTRIIVCGDEAAVVMRNEGLIGGRPVVVEGVEIWKVAADGKVCAVRAYFNADSSVNSDYFLPEPP